jgi:hypothetical protein
MIMTIRKCDKYGRTIKTEPIRAGIGLFVASVELCNKCGKGIIDFLVSNNLLVEKLKREKFI